MTFSMCAVLEWPRGTTTGRGDLHGHRGHPGSSERLLLCRGTSNVLKHTACRGGNVTEVVLSWSVGSALAVNFESHNGDTAAPIHPVIKHERPSMRLRDLARQHEPNARPLWLGRKKRDE